jgi:death-on-curing protein
VIYLSLAELLHVAERTLGSGVEVRDHGLLEAAVARPQTSVFGADAYSTLEEKAAAFVHSIVTNHALVDGNKRLGLAGLLAFLGVNGRRLTMTNDEAYEFIMRIACGELRDVAEIAAILAEATSPWSGES